MVVLEVLPGNFAPLDPAVAVPRAAESGAGGGVAVKRWGVGAAVGRAAGVGGDVVAAPGRVAVDVDTTPVTRL